MSIHPIIVVEGPDGSGKTTLSNKIQEYMNSKYIHLTYRFKDRMFDYHTAGIELCLKLAKHQPVVLDRWWPSEKIYADVFRGGSKWPLAGRMLDRVALKHGITYVFCIPADSKKYFERFDKLKTDREEMYNSMNGVYEGYQDLYRKLGPRMDCVHYDLDVHGKQLDTYVEWLVDHAVTVRNQVDEEFELSGQRLVAGNSFNPKVLLVGDQSNPKTRREVWPFFEYGNSSLWMAKALDALDISESKLAWANSIDSDGSVNPLLGYLSEKFPHMPIVALGHSAAGILSRLDIEHRMVRHPQWYRRFAGNDFSDFSFLKELTNV